MVVAIVGDELGFAGAVPLGRPPRPATHADQRQLVVLQRHPAAAPVTVAGATHLLVAQAPGEIAHYLREHWREG